MFTGKESCQGPPLSWAWALVFSYSRKGWVRASLILDMSTYLHALLFWGCHIINNIKEESAYVY